MTDDELKRLLEGHTAENRHLFATTAEGLRDQIRLVAEGVSEVNEVTRRESAEIRDEMRRGFAETQAMIKFSHAELDRHVRGAITS